MKQTPESLSPEAEMVGGAWARAGIGVPDQVVGSRMSSRPHIFPGVRLSRRGIIPLVLTWLGRKRVNGWYLVDRVPHQVRGAVPAAGGTEVRSEDGKLQEWPW